MWINVVLVIVALVSFAGFLWTAEANRLLHVQIATQRESIRKELIDALPAYVHTELSKAAATRDAWGSARDTYTRYVQAKKNVRLAHAGRRELVELRDAQNALSDIMCCAPASSHSGIRILDGAKQAEVRHG